MSSDSKADRKYRNYSSLLIFLMFIEFVFYFYIKPIKMYFFISDLKYITTSIYTRKETLMGILYILVFSLLYSIAIISYEIISKNKIYSIKEVLRKSRSNLTCFFSAKLLLLLTIDTIDSFLKFRVISYSGYLGYSFTVALNVALYATSFSLFVLISLNLLNSGKKYLNKKYNFAKIKTFIYSKTLLEIFIATLILHIPHIIYYKFFLSPNFSDFFSNNKPNPIWNFMVILNLYHYQKVDLLYLFLAFSGRALACFFIFVKVFEFVDETQEME